MLDTVDWRSLKDDKLTEQATQNLIKALFMQDAAAGKDASVAARFAIRNIGSGATKALLAAYVGKNEELNQFAERNGLARWRYMFGHQLVELLWDVGDRKAAPTIMELMGRSINPPPADVARLPPEKRGEWTAANLNRLAASALTVGSLVNDNSIEYARKILTQTNPPIDAAVFKQVQLAIGLMGTAASRKLAWELYRAEDEKVAAAQKEIDDLDAQVKKLEEKGKEKDEEALKKLRTQGRAKLSVRNGLLMRKANMLQPLYLGLGADGVEAYQKEAVESPQDIIKEDAAEPMALGYYEAVSQCKQDAGCYIKMLQAWKGKLAEIPKNIKAARKTLLDERKKVRDEANKFKDAAKLKEEEYKKLVKEVNDMTEALNKKKKITKKEADDHKALVEKAQTVFNEVKQAWEDRNKVIGKVEPFKKGVKDAEKQVHMLEKAVLMLGEYKDRHSEAVKLACDLFAETKPLFKPNMPAYFEQFRQWTIVFLEHAGTKDDLPIIEALLAGEQGDGKRKELTAWTLRLESLIARIGRR